MKCDARSGEPYGPTVQLPSVLRLFLKKILLLVLVLLPTRASLLLPMCQIRSLVSVSPRFWRRSSSVGVETAGKVRVGRWTGWLDGSNAGLPYGILAKRGKYNTHPPIHGHEGSSRKVKSKSLHGRECWIITVDHSKFLWNCQKIRGLENDM